jgi:hypothetical protein
MNDHLRTIVIACLAIFTAASAAGQGLYWESTVSRAGNDQKALSKSYYMPKMFKEKGSDEDEWVIVRLDKKMFVMVNDADKEYSEMTFDDIERMMKKVGGEMSGAMAEMEKQMANLTPEQRKMMKEMMGGKLPGMKGEAKVEVSGTGEKKSISGYSCTKHVVKRGGEEVMTLWTTDDIKGVGSMGEEMKEFGKRMAALNPMGDQSETEAMMNVDGFPIRTEMGEITTVVTKVEEKTIPAAEFEVPAGYKKVKPRMMEKLDEEG